MTNGEGPTLTTWVTKDVYGQPRRIPVSEMTDSHLWRWVRFFRKKFRDERRFRGSDADLDAMIQSEIITAPAIYREAKKRGVIDVLGVKAEYVVESPDPVLQKESKPLGHRRIDLEDD